jgi:hypothetical protein
MEPAPGIPQRPHRRRPRPGLPAPKSLHPGPHSPPPPADDSTELREEHEEANTRRRESSPQEAQEPRPHQPLHPVVGAPPPQLRHRHLYLPPLQRPPPHPRLSRRPGRRPQDPRSPRPTQRAARSPSRSSPSSSEPEARPPKRHSRRSPESRRATTTPRPPEGAVSRTGTGLVPPQVPRRMPSRLRSPQAQGRQVAASTRLDLPSLTAPSVIGPCQETGRGACASGRGRANVQGARVIRRESRELLGALRRRSIYARSAFPRDPNT